jgi:hypothetical protein
MHEQELASTLMGTQEAYTRTKRARKTSFIILYEALYGRLVVDRSAITKRDEITHRSSVVVVAILSFHLSQVTEGDASSFHRGHTRSSGKSLVDDYGLHDGIVVRKVQRSAKQQDVRLGLVDRVVHPACKPAASGAAPKQAQRTTNLVIAELQCLSTLPQSTSGPEA